MNIRLITFGSLLSAIIGAVLGLSMADLSYTSNPSQILNPVEEKYERMNYQWVYIGAIGGFVIGIGQELIREINQQQEKEE